MRHPHRWFRLWILLGVALGMVLLVTSISNYSWLSQRVLIEQLRRDLAALVADLGRQLQQAGVANDRDLNLLVERARQRTTGKVVWIHIRDHEGNILAPAGVAGEPAFRPEFVRSQFRNRQPVFKTVKRNAGRVLVEVFPLRLPARRLGFVEMAVVGDIT